MTKPQIAILHYSAPPVVGGVENIIAHHSRLMLEAGYPLTILTGRGGTDPIFASAHVAVIPEIDSEYPLNVEISHALNQGQTPPQFAEFQKRIEQSLAAQLAKGEILIVHNVFNTHFNVPLTAALHRLIDRGVMRPSVLAWCHDISRYVNPHSGEELRQGFPWDLFRTFRPEVTYVTVSHARQRTLAEILRCPLDDIRVIPNGVYAASLLGLSDLGVHLVEEFGLLKADVVMLMPVRITQAKNIEFALRVTGAVKQLGLVPKLVVTGPPDPHSAGIQDYVEELLQLRQDLGLEKDAAFVYAGTSRMPRPFEIGPDTVGELYRVADLVLMPSHREGFGLPILEAALAGKPVFCTRVPALEEVGSDVIHLIESNELPEHVAARIQAWTREDLPRLRRCVRQGFIWSTLFRRTIEPLFAEMMRE